MDSKFKLIAGLVFLVLIFSLGVYAVNYLNRPLLIDEEPTELEVTVYNSNLGVVKEIRNKYLFSGINDVLYTGVASQIDPTSVKLKALEGGIRVLEQNYEYDLVSKEKILEKYIDKNITGYQIYGDRKELVEGTLLSYSGGQVVLKTKQGVLKIISLSEFDLPELPEGLITKPTLHWMIEADESENKSLELSYMTSGMSWKADYVTVVNADDTILDLTGWVTITNNAGTTFKDASLKLVAGDVNRVYDYDAIASGDRYMAMESKAAAPQFTEESLFEYHLYDLQRPTTLRDKEQKQIELLSGNNVDVEKEFVYENTRWYTSNTKVRVMLNFENTEDNNLGMPLPKGRVRVFKKDSEEKLQFIGEDSIDHTPKDETLRIFVGEAFDVLGERKQMDYNILAGWYEYEWDVILKNHKDEDITVTVLENTGGDWEIVKENYQHEKESNNKIKWKIPVEPNSESKLTYKIRYKRY
ncbi:MAG: DUF4139 domain-containing protein [Candidatus Altiarchaeota archaeon]